MLNFSRREFTEDEILEEVRCQDERLRRAALDRCFSRSERWSSLGLLRRVARVCRVVFGLLLFSACLLLIRTLLHDSSINFSLWQTSLRVGAIAYLALLAWCVGCMFIWRGVYSPSQPSSGGSPPPEPPADGAPRPAPLRPFSPLIVSAHAEAPDGRKA